MPFTARFGNAFIVMTMILAALVTIPAKAHDASRHGAVPPELPIAVGGPFALIDQRGMAVTDADFHGQFMLVFFGYANCTGICPTGLRNMTAALDLLGEAGSRVAPVLITVDPVTDTKDNLAPAVAAIHPRLVGLTGSHDALSAAAKAYKVSAKLVGWTVKKEPIIEHGSFIYLMGPDGRFVTLYPPILDPAAIADSIRQYL